MEPAIPHFTSEKAKRRHSKQVGKKTQESIVTSAGRAVIFSILFIQLISLILPPIFIPFYDL